VGHEVIENIGPIDREQFCLGFCRFLVDSGYKTMPNSNKNILVRSSAIRTVQMLFNNTGFDLAGFYHIANLVVLEKIPKDPRLGFSN
jgi:hypothetical protein